MVLIRIALGWINVTADAVGGALAEVALPGGQIGEAGDVDDGLVVGVESALAADGEAPIRPDHFVGQPAVGEFGLRAHKALARVGLKRPASDLRIDKTADAAGYIDIQLDLVLPIDILHAGVALVGRGVRGDVVCFAPAHGAAPLLDDLVRRGQRGRTGHKPEW